MIKKDIKRTLPWLMTLFLVGQVLGAESDKVTVSGYLKDATTGEYLIGATVFEKNSYSGAVTNTYGFYSLTLEKGDCDLLFTYIGYGEVLEELDLKENTKMNISLEPAGVKLDEVVITSERKDKNVTSTQMSMETLDMKQLDKLPVLFGEKDILKTIQLLPGISTTSEGGNGFSVRGGSVDQNLILLDEAPVYSASHLMGFFSVFNADAIKGMDVYKGGIPAKYGGRASSVLDISMRDGNTQKFAGSGGLGLISSRLTLEGPILDDKMSFIVSGRRSYADIAAKGAQIIDDAATLYFYDLNTKINYRINDENRLYLSGYFGKDDFGYEDFGMSWGNATGTLRWNHLFSARLFSNTSLIYSNYDYGFAVGDDIEMSSGIVDYGIKQDFTYFLNPENTMKFGFNSTNHTFDPGQLVATGMLDLEIVLEKKKAIESGVYVSNEQKFNSRFSADYGVRLSMFNQIGEGTAKTYNDDNEVIDSVYYGKGELMQSYYGFEPRLAMNYILTPKSSVKASYNRMSQYLHLMSNSTSGQPTDTWTPSTTNIKPLTVNQVAVGYFRNFFDDQYEFSVETYYKDMKNVTDYKDGADITLNEDLESYVLQGDGRSAGLEFYVKKRFGRMTGWLSYTLSRTENQIDGINDGEWYATKLDKTHDISIVGSYQMTDRMSLAGTWVYYTGNAVTFPSGKYEYDGKVWSYYTERNGYRMPSYHRFDLNLHLLGKSRKRFETSWDFSVYNAYNRLNAYTISFRESMDEPGTTEAVKLSLFGIVPSISWNFKF